jgi:hypothetical protein
MQERAYLGPAAWLAHTPPAKCHPAARPWPQNYNLPLPANASNLGGLCHKVADCRFQISDFRIPMTGEY